MKKIALLTSLICLLMLPAIAQKVSLKKTLDASDQLYLNNQAAECFAFDANMQISFKSQDLYDDKDVKGDKPATMDNIKLLEKKLKGTVADADVFAAMANIYDRLKMKEEAEANRQKSIYLLNSVIEDHPDSVEALYTLAAVHMSGGNFEESIEILRKSLVIKPDYQDPNLMIAMMYLFSGQFDSIYPFIDGRIKKYPDIHSSYISLPIYYFYNMYQTVSVLEPREKILTLNTDSVLGMDLLRNYYERDKSSFKKEYLYRISYQTTLCAYLVFKSIARPDFDNRNIRFDITGADKEKLLAAESFFQSCLKNKEVESKYLVNKILGNIYILKDEPKKAIPYIKKAIELKPISKSTITNNADEEYENLIACHFILKDSAACEKILLEKIKINPAIDPNSLDYQHLGNYYVSKKKFDKAEKMYSKALELNYGNNEAMLGMALLRFLQGNKKEANDYINRAYTINKNSWQIYCLSGIMALKEGDTKNAYEFFQLTKKLNDSKWIDSDIIDKYFEVK